MALELEIDVPESREVTLTLPPDTPVGRTRLTLKSIAPPPDPDSKFEREKRAFYRLLPELLQTHRGKVVAIHDEQVIAVGDDSVVVGLEAYKKVGYVALYVSRVADERPIHRLRGPRELRSNEA